MTVKLNYEVLGSGKPLVILHGLFGSGRNLRAMARRFAETFTVYLVDLRNHGNSAHADSMTYPEMAQDVSTLLAGIEPGPVNIIGHSMGGKVAMACALEDALAIEKLVVLDIAPVSYRGNFVEIIAALLELQPATLKSRKQASERLAVPIPEANLRLFLLQNLVQGDTGLNWRINLPGIRDSLADIGGFPAYSSEHCFHGPSLFLGGADSNYILPEHHEKILEYFPGARLESIANAGHWLHADQPEQVYQAMFDFLQ